MTLLLLAVLAGFAWYVMSPDERTRLLRAALDASRHLPSGLRYARHAAAPGYAEPDSFRDALSARTPRVLVTPAIVALNLAVFACMIFGPGSIGDPETLVRWGANYGPRTTNGEWTRLVTSLFVHAGPLHLLVNVAGLVVTGVLLERLVGHVAFAAVYAAAGVVSSFVSLSNHPVGVTAGASGAVFGIYGLLIASVFWGLLQRSDLTIPLAALKNLAPPAAIFFLYHAAAVGIASGPEIAGLIAGFACGLLFARGLCERRPPLRQVVSAVAATLAIVVASAVPLRGLVDVRPEIERIVDIETRTAAAYRAAVDRFRRGRSTTRALAELIDRTILPEIASARTRLKELGRVPPEHRPLVAAADEYLRLRDESWRLRSTALHGNSTQALRKADRAEQESLNAFGRIRPEDE